MNSHFSCSIWTSIQFDVCVCALVKGKEYMRHLCTKPKEVLYLKHPMAHWLMVQTTMVGYGRVWRPNPNGDPSPRTSRKPCMMYIYRERETLNIYTYIWNTNCDPCFEWKKTFGWLQPFTIQKIEDKHVPDSRCIYVIYIYMVSIYVLWSNSNFKIKINSIKQYQI